MEKIRLRWGLVLVCVFSFSAALSGVVAEEATVGTFLQDLARINSLDASSPSNAHEALVAAGYRLPDGMTHTDRLSEEDVVSIAGSLGLRVTTTRPETEFSQQKVDRLLRHFGEDLRASRDQFAHNAGEDGGSAAGDESADERDDPPVDPSSKGKKKGHGHSKGKGHGKGKGKGHHHSPTDPC